MIALPTESVTENLPFPEYVTTILTTQFPSSSNSQSPSINQVNDYDTPNNGIVNSVTEESATDLSINDYTTIANDLLIESSGNGEKQPSKKDESFVEKTNFIAPRPFLRTTSPPRNNFFPRNTSPSFTSTLNQSNSRRRSRPSIVRSSTENYSSQTQEFDEQQQYTRRPTVSYRPGYRGTARFKFSTTKSGEYDPKAFDSQSINSKFIDDNRLRSLNLDRVNTRPPTLGTTPTSTTEVIVKKSTRRRPTLTRTSTSTTEEPELSEESTTEYRIIEAKNRFNLKDNDRPERLRFELTAGGKINFGFSSVKSRENSATPKIENTDSSKIKVITGPLDKSPVASSRNYKKGFVEEIPIQTSPETVTIKRFSKKLDLNKIPLNRADINSFVADEDLRTETSTDQPIEDDTTIGTLRSRPSQTRFAQREKSNIETEIKNELSNEIGSLKISNQNHISSHRRERTKTEQENKILETSSLLKSDEETEEVTQGKFLTRVRVSDIFNRRGNAIEDSENSETQDAPEESTLRTRVIPSKGFIFSPETGEFVTESSIENENEVEFSTEENDEETTLMPLKQSIRSNPHRLTVRKRPVKKIDFHATRQTITESVNSKDVNESTSDDYDIDFENVSSPHIHDVRTRPTRARFVTRKRIIDGDSDTSDTGNQKVDEAIERPSPKTTKKRVLVIRTKSGAIKSEVDIIPSTDEPSTEATIDNIPKIDDSDVTRRRIKFVRLKATTERISEESTHKSIVARTRVFKRPTSTVAPLESEETSTTARSSLRFSTRRRVVKINKKPVEDVDENNKSYNFETVNDSTTAPRKSFKVLKQKTPRVIVEKPLEDDTLVIKTDEQNQQIDGNENGEAIINDNSEGISDEPSARPVLKYPTRPGGKVSVAIRRRPFSQGSRTTTLHPASTRLNNDGIPPTRPRVTIRRRFKPSSASTSESSISIIDEIENEKRIALGERNRKIFKTKYRKFPTSTSSPNITQHNSEINTDSEISDYEELVDSTDIPINNNDGTILQPTTKPRFSLKTRFTTSTTAKPTTLQHVFAIDEGEDLERQKNGTDDNSADKVIEKLQKLIEINRIVEVYSKEEKLKLLKNKKLKSIKEGELTVERPPALDKFGEISRQVIIKLKKKPTFTTRIPEDVRSPKNVMFAETVFGNTETSTISLEGLFEREKKELEVQKELEEDIHLSNEKKETSHIATEPNETNPIIISISNLDQVILSRAQPSLNEELEDTTFAVTTENYVDEETTLR